MTGTVAEEDTKTVQLGWRESFLAIALFMILFGGTTITIGFVAGIYSAQQFFLQFDTTEATQANVISRYCDEALEAYKARDNTRVRTIKEQDKVIDYVNTFLGNEEIALQLKHMMTEKAVGGPEE